MRIVLSTKSENIQKHFQKIIDDNSTEIVPSQSFRDVKKQVDSNRVPLICVDDKKCPDPHKILKKIKRLSPTTQIIYVTDNFDSNNAAKWMNNGGLAYLSKPVSIEKLKVNVIPFMNLFENQQFLVETHKKLGQELRQQKEDIKKEASNDGLTGLLNKKYFEEKTREILLAGTNLEKKATLAMIDVDHFKEYNDANGHPQGDKALEKVAQILDDETRRADITGRVGGEEFALFLPDTDQYGGYVTVERIRSAVESKRFEGEHRLPEGCLTISAGLSSFPAHGETLEELMESADRAMYFSKTNGRNQTTITELREFSYDTDGRNPESISVVGEFNNWKSGVDTLEEQEDGHWYKIIPVPEGTEEYEFEIHK